MRIVKIIIKTYICLICVFDAFNIFLCDFTIELPISMLVPTTGGCLKDSASTYQGNKIMRFRQCNPVHVEHSDARSVTRLGAAAAFAGILFAAATSAHALVIVPIFGPSITSLANASAVEAAFNAAASVFSRSFADPVTVRINVSWGSVGGRALPAGDLGSSLTNLYSGWGYSEVTAALSAASVSNSSNWSLAQAVANLAATDPTRLENFGIPYAEAQALGLLPANLATTAGSIGFKSGMTYDFNPADGISANAYDFQGLAEHEIEEVLGRVTGLQSSAPQYATPFDLFRYTAKGVSSFSYGAHAYFSLDGGASNLGNFNYLGSGDRSDWFGGSTSSDIQNAYFSVGKLMVFSSADLSGLYALGWDTSTAYVPGALTGSIGTTSGSASVPEPASWAALLTGLALVGTSLRRRRAPRVRSAG